MKVGAFTKSFKDWEIPTVCRRFREIGLDGYTFGRQGHVEPSPSPSSPRRGQVGPRSGFGDPLHYRHH